MIGKMFRGIWTHLLIAFYDSYTIEGFERTNKKFELPTDLSQLDSAAKRRMTICNLFANQNLLILEIVKLLDSSLHQVVPALIENGLIKERRRNPNKRRAESAKASRSAGLSILPEASRVNGEPAEPDSRSNAANAYPSEPMPDKRAPSGIANVAPSSRHAG